MKLTNSEKTYAIQYNHPDEMARFNAGKWLEIILGCGPEMGKYLIPAWESWINDNWTQEIQDLEEVRI